MLFLNLNDREQGRNMKKLCDFLGMTSLFAGLDQSIYHEYCYNTNIKTYWKGEVIVNEGDPCTGIGIIVDGQVARQKYSASGEFSTLDLLGPGETFGTTLIFSTRKKYPFTLEAVSHCKILKMTRDVLLSMISKNPQLLLNYMQQLSDKSTEQDKRINLLSQKTLRLKIGHYLLQLLEDQLEDHDRSLEEALQYPTTYAVELPVSKEVVSRLLAMPRPSFSRELISMEKDGLIRVNGRVIWLLDIRGLASEIVFDSEEELPAG